MSTTYPTSSVPAGPTKAELTFLTPPADGSMYRLDATAPAETAISAKEVIAVPINDIRGKEHAFNLEAHAFEALSNVKSATTHETFADDDAVKQFYYPEVTELLLQHMGAQEVTILGHGVRRQGVDGQRQPIQFVHADHSVDVAQRMAKEYVERLQKHHLLHQRRRIISVWRPLNGPVESMPLAFVAGDSLKAHDIFPIEYQFPDRRDWFTGLKYNDTQRWHYWSGMQNDERLLLKCTESVTDPHVASQTPHTAFVHAGSPSGARPRESIEVRALVFG
nr:hypothetical protein CFP56_19290 [Quercus suber]